MTAEDTAGAIPLMHDHEAEVSLLSACLWDKAARQAARHVMLPGDFYEPWHEAIYDAMLALDRAGRDVDPVTVRDHLISTKTATPGIDTILVDLTTRQAFHYAATEHATIIHRWALRRKVANLGRGLTQRAMDPGEAPERLVSTAVTLLQGIRDGAAGDVTAMTLSEVMEVPDDEPHWVIPGLLEAGDRLMLTGTEGAGKSALMRQLSIMPAAGVHPFTDSMIPPVRSLIIDAENKMTQIRRQTRPLLDWLQRNGAENPMDRVMVEALYPRRINLTSDRDLGSIHQLLDAFQPQIVVIGPIYRMSPRALQTDDEAHPFLAALDTITERGCALIVEAHAGHSKEQNGRSTSRELRPRGSSALIGWPEFGLGLRGLPRGLADLEPWRGGREARPWPTRMRRGPGNRWIETHPDDQGDPGYDAGPPLQPVPPAPDPQGALDDVWAGTA